jgi:hypothetical protein
MSVWGTWKKDFDKVDLTQRGVGYEIRTGIEEGGI